MIDKDWDILVIFDSCRYDIFSEYYKEIFPEAKLSKRDNTPFGITSTQDWIDHTFSQKNCSDIVYVCPIYSLKDWIKDCSSKFFKVIEVWRTHWNREMETVLPDDMTGVAMDVIEKYKEKRIIIHYMQPHHPYLHWGGHKTKGDKLKPFLGDEKPVKHISYKRKLANIAEGICPHLFWRITGRLGKLPKWNLGYIWYMHGREGVIRGYTMDLLYIMECVNKIKMRFPDKKIVISADHGEELGDGRIHKIYRMNYKLQRPKTKQVLEVPWCEL